METSEPAMGYDWGRGGAEGYSGEGSPWSMAGWHRHLPTPARAAAAAAQSRRRRRPR